MTPRDVDDCAYAFVSANGIPSKPSTIISQLQEHLSAYWKSIHQRLVLADSISISHPTYLPDEFVPPAFALMEAGSTVSTGTVTWEELQARARFVLVGPPGSGKTTCLRMIGIEAERLQHSNSARIPVYLALRNVRAENEILSRTARLLNLDSGSAAFQQLLTSGELVLLLDGLDEIQSDLRPLVLNEVSGIARNFPDLGIIISSRDAGYDSRFSGFSYLQVQPFTPVQLSEWVRRRMGRTSRGAAERFVDTVRWDTRLRDVASNPLLLSIAATLFESTGVLLPTVSGLLVKYIDALVQDWDAARSIRRWKETGFHREYALKVLCRTAYRTSQTGRHSFSEELFDSWEAEWSDRADSSRFLEYVEQGSCILQKSGQGREWTFSHKTIQEVLCAKYLIERLDSAVNALSPRNLHDSTFNIVRFACEMTPDSSPLVDALLGQRTNESLRAALVACILVQPVSLVSNSERQATRFLTTYLREIENDVDVVVHDNEGSSWQLLLQLKRSQAGPKWRIADCAGVLTSLLGAGDPERKRHLAKAFEQDRHSRLITVIRERLNKGSLTASVIDEKSDSLRFEGDSADSLP